MLRPWVSVALLAVACWWLSAVWVSGQTFQYSHGWTNGRKRAGSGALVPAARLPLPAAADLEGQQTQQPCRVRCLRLLLQAAALPQVYVPPEAWQQLEEESASQRGGGVRLRHALPPPGAAADSDEDM
uniref:Pro-corazonin n=1 Tax=Locusta migratoria TaxID=7004 RepID=A0A0M5MQS3_LOCMI|nr:prepro-corazonin [Locusta migratoria]